MKKTWCVLLLAVLAGSAGLFADHPSDRWAVGAVTGAGWGTVGGGVFNPGINVKAPHVPIFWSADVFITPWHVGMGVTGDYYIIDRDLAQWDATNKNGTYTFNLDWYLGVGGFARLYLRNNGDTSGMVFAAGGRVPIGVSWHITDKWEAYSAIIPGVGVELPLGVYGTVSWELGFRYWLLP